MYRVYTDVDGDSNADTCKAMCAFDYDTITQDPNDLGCQFWAFNGTFCYLGSMEFERSVHVASDPLTVNLLESEVLMFNFFLELLIFITFSSSRRWLLRLEIGVQSEAASHTQWGG